MRCDWKRWRQKRRRRQWQHLDGGSSSSRGEGGEAECFRDALLAKLILRQLR